MIAIKDLVVGERTSLLIDFLIEELFHMLNRNPQSRAINIYALRLCDGTNLLQPFVTMLKTTSLVMSIKITVGF